MNSYRRGTQKGLEHRIRSPQFEVYHPVSMWVWSPTQKPSKPHSFRIFMEIPHVGMIDYSSPAPLPSLKNGGEAESSTLLIKVWSFW